MIYKAAETYYSTCTQFNHPLVSCMRLGKWYHHTGRLDINKNPKGESKDGSKNKMFKREQWLLKYYRFRLTYRLSPLTYWCSPTIGSLKEIIMLKNCQWSETYQCGVYSSCWWDSWQGYYKISAPSFIRQKTTHKC